MLKLFRNVDLNKLYSHYNPVKMSELCTNNVLNTICQYHLKGKPMNYYIEIELLNILIEQKNINPNSPLIRILNDLLSKDILIQRQTFELLNLLYTTKDEPYAVICHLLGLCYNGGIGIQSNDASAFEMFEKASQLNYVHADFWLGDYYAWGLGVGIDTPRAHALRENSAKGGNVNALFYLGSCYRDGNRVEQDFKKSFELTLASAEKGHRDAENNTGCNYYNGLGVVKNLKKSFEFCSKAVSKGTRVGACFLLGLFYYQGDESFGLEKDLKKAFELFTLAKDRIPKSKYYLGLCYLNGEGITKDERQAHVLFRDAGLSHNIADAKYQLALCYQKGVGITKDAGFALTLFSELAEAGHRDAIYQLSHLHKESNFPISKTLFTKAFDLFLQDSSDLSFRDCKFQLSFLDKDGEFIKKNISKIIQRLSCRSDDRGQIQGQLQNAERIRNRALLGCNVFFMKKIFLSQEPTDNLQNDIKKKQELGEKINLKMQTIRRLSEQAGLNLDKATACFYVEKDLKKTSELLRVAIQGFGEGFYQMGLLFLEEKWIKDNEKSAFSEFEEAAALDYVPGIYQVGLCYENGIGVVKNLEKAKEYYSIAAIEGRELDKKMEKETAASIEEAADSKRNVDHKISGGLGQSSNKKAFQH